MQSPEGRPRRLGPQCCSDRGTRVLSRSQTRAARSWAEAYSWRRADSPRPREDDRISHRLFFQIRGEQFWHSNVPFSLAPFLWSWECWSKLTPRFWSFQRFPSLVPHWSSITGCLELRRLFTSMSRLPPLPPSFPPPSLPLPSPLPVYLLLVLARLGCYNKRA